MKITPLDIRRKEFRRSVRGYLDEDVDVFLDAVADELERLSEENTGLQDRAQALEQQVAGHAHIREALEKTLVAAQIQSEEIRSKAEKEKESILRDAEAKAKSIVGDLYAQTQKVQQTLMQLKLLEEDFRFKFRALLEGYLKLLEDSPILLSGLQETGKATGSVQGKKDVADNPTVETDEPTEPEEAGAKASARAKEGAEKAAAEGAGAAAGAEKDFRSPGRQEEQARPAVDDTTEELTVESNAPVVEKETTGQDKAGGAKKGGEGRGVFFGKPVADPDDPFPGGNANSAKVRDFEW